MKIIVDCQPVLQNCLPFYSARFILGCHEYLLQNKNETEWLFLMDKTYTRHELLKRIPAKNILFKKKLLPGWKFWYDSQLPSIIKKHKAGLLITVGGIASASPVPQCAWVPHLPENSGSKKNKKFFNLYKKKLQETLHCAQMVLTCSEKKRQQLVQEYDVDRKRIRVVRSAPDKRYRILSWTEKETIKVKYAAGKEFFVVSVDGPQQNLVNLLMAFSQFKKRQQSNIQLVFAGKGLKNESGFLGKLETFRYRSDVHVYDEVDEAEIIQLISAAYALVHPFDDDEPGKMVLNAFKAGVPVITSDKGSLAEIAADAALYAGIHDIDLLAGQLMLLYKDENLRMQLIEKGKLQQQQFDYDESMELLQTAMMRSANKQS